MHKEEGDFSESLWQKLFSRNKKGGLGPLMSHEEEPVEDLEPDARVLINNILSVQNKTAYDVMVPRADIIAIEQETPLEEVSKIMMDSPHSRYPIYHDGLDDIAGMVHVKDVFAATRQPLDKFSLEKIQRRILFVAPRMRALDLLLQMRVNRLHMALVVDEYGGTDGLITIEDLVEEIVGEIEDEHDVARKPTITQSPSGVFTVDARLLLEELEETMGVFLEEEERNEDIDTVGGLVFTLAGRVPSRGEIVRHNSGIEFEVTQCDLRNIKQLRIRRPDDKNVSNL